MNIWICIVDIGTYKMELVGVDSAFQETVIKFKFIVQRNLSVN